MSENSGGSGVSILGLLGVLFIGLKLTGHITWSWWWVLAPFWGGIVLAVGFLVILAAIAAWAARKQRYVSIRPRR